MRARLPSLRRLTDIVVLVLGLSLLLVVVGRYLPFTFRTWQVPDAYIEDVFIDASSGVDFSAAPKTLVLVLRSDCVFCQESMPFYRRLLSDRDAADVQVVVAAPPFDTQIGEYLESERVYADSVVFVAADALPVSGTPTLLMVDNTGLITHAWLGQLNAEREQEVLSAAALRPPARLRVARSNPAIRPHRADAAPGPGPAPA